MDSSNTGDDPKKLLNETMAILCQKVTGTKDQLIQNKVNDAVQQLKTAVSTVENRIKASHMEIERKTQEKSEQLRNEKKRCHQMVEHQKYQQLRQIYSTFYQWVQTVTQDNYQTHNQAHRYNNNNNNNVNNNNINNQIPNINISNNRNNYGNNTNIINMSLSTVPPRETSPIRRPTNVPALRKKHIKKIKQEK
eukprot:764192_1